MKCGACSKTHGDECVSLLVGDIKICTECVETAATKKKGTVGLNEILTYINTYRHGCSKRKMREVCASFYNEEEIFNAKVLLQKAYPTLLGEVIRRQDSKERTKNGEGCWSSVDSTQDRSDHHLFLFIYFK